MTAISNNITIVDGVEHLTLRDGTTKPLFQFSLGLKHPGGLEFSTHWDHLPTIESQLRYFQQRRLTHPNDAYRPVVQIDMIEDIYSDGAAYGVAMYYEINWSDIDEEAIDNGNIVTQALKGTPPRRDQLVVRPIHGLLSIPVGMCVSGFHENNYILDGKVDTDFAVCNKCWSEL